MVTIYLIYLIATFDSGVGVFGMDLGVSDSEFFYFEFLLLRGRGGVAIMVWEGGRGLGWE